MSIYVLLEYVKECKIQNIPLDRNGLYKFKKLWN